MLQLRKLLSRLDHSLALLVGIDMFLKGNGCQERVVHHQSTSIEHDLPKNIEVYETKFCWGMVCRNLGPEIIYILIYFGQITRNKLFVHQADLLSDENSTIPAISFCNWRSSGTALPQPILVSSLYLQCFCKFFREWVALHTSRLVAINWHLLLRQILLSCFCLSMC